MTPAGECWASGVRCDRQGVESYTDFQQESNVESPLSKLALSAFESPAPSVTEAGAERTGGGLDGYALRCTISMVGSGKMNPTPCARSASSRARNSFLKCHGRTR